MNEEEIQAHLYHLAEKLGQLILHEEALMHQHAEIMEQRRETSQELWEESKRLAEIRKHQQE